MHRPSEIRTYMSVAIEAAGVEGRLWHEARCPADLFEGLAPELGEGEAQHAFAVGLPESSPLPGRGTPGRGFVSSTTLEIVWSRVLGAERQIEDYSSALDDEAHLLSVVLALGGQGRNPSLSSITRRATTGGSTGLFIGRIRITVPHLYPLP